MAALPRRGVHGHSHSATLLLLLCVLVLATVSSGRFASAVEGEQPQPCSLNCFHGGTMEETLCQCQCPPPYLGQSCQLDASPGPFLVNSGFEWSTEDGNDSVDPGWDASLAADVELVSTPVRGGSTAVKMTKSSAAGAPSNLHLRQKAVNLSPGESYTLQAHFIVESMELLGGASGAGSRGLVFRVSETPDGPSLAEFVQSVPTGNSAVSPAQWGAYSLEVLAPSSQQLYFHAQLRGVSSAVVFLDDLVLIVTPCGKTCQNGGTLTPKGCRCSCLPSFTGRLCEIDVSPSSSLVNPGFELCLLDPLKKITDLGPLVGPGWDEDAGRTIRLISPSMSGEVTVHQGGVSAKLDATTAVQDGGQQLTQQVVGLTAGRKYTFLAFVYLQQLSEGLTLELRLTAQKDGSVLARKALSETTNSWQGVNVDFAAPLSGELWVHIVWENLVSTSSGIAYVDSTNFFPTPIPGQLTCLNGGTWSSEEGKCLCTPNFVGQTCDINVTPGPYLINGGFEISLADGSAIDSPDGVLAPGWDAFDARNVKLITKEVGPVLYNFAAMMDFDVGGGVGQVLHQKVTDLHVGRQYTFLARYALSSLLATSSAGGLVFSVSQSKDGSNALASQTIKSPNGLTYEPVVLNFVANLHEMWVHVRWEDVSSGVAFVDEMALFPTPCGGCQNGGTRQSDVVSCRCSCPRGFTGEACQFDVRPGPFLVNGNFELSIEDGNNNVAPGWDASRAGNVELMSISVDGSASVRSGQYSASFSIPSSGSSLQGMVLQQQAINLPTDGRWFVLLAHIRVARLNLDSSGRRGGVGISICEDADCTRRIYHRLVDKVTGGNEEWKVIVAQFQPTASTMFFRIAPEGDISLLYAFVDDVAVFEAGRWEPVQPVVGCVESLGGRKKVKFGYRNPNSFEVLIPVGYDNEVEGVSVESIADQPTQFLPGEYTIAFSISIDSTSSVVWRLNGRSVSSSSAQECTVRPVLECVYPSPDRQYQTWKAKFGYLSEFSEEVNISVGSLNLFNINGPDRGQVTRFLPGRQREVFTVDFVDGQQLVWRLGSRTATASNNRNSYCFDVVFRVEPILECVEPDPPGNNWLAHFSFNNSRNTKDLSIPVGSSNSFHPAPENRQQLTHFPAASAGGSFPNHPVTVSFQPGRSVVWNLDGLSAEAKVQSGRCPPRPPRVSAVLDPEEESEEESKGGNGRGKDVKVAKIIKWSKPETTGGLNIEEYLVDFFVKCMGVSLDTAREVPGYIRVTGTNLRVNLDWDLLVNLALETWLDDLVAALNSQAGTSGRELLQQSGQLGVQAFEFSVQIRALTSAGSSDPSSQSEPFTLNVDVDAAVETRRTKNYNGIIIAASASGGVIVISIIISIFLCRRCRAAQLQHMKVKPSAPGSPPGLQTPRTASKGLSRGPSYLWSPKSLSSKRRQDVEDSDTSVHETEGDSLDVDEDADAIPVVSNMAKRYSQPSPTVVSSVSTGSVVPRSLPVVSSAEVSSGRSTSSGGTCTSASLPGAPEHVVYET